MAIYKGFSTIGILRKWKLNDVELVKRDLLNHFQTRKGERVMQPNFGSIIWDILFDPFTEDTKNMIVEDVNRIISLEPRVQLTQQIVREFEHGIQIELNLLFNTMNQTQTMFLNYNRAINNMTSS